VNKLIPIAGTRMCEYRKIAVKRPVKKTIAQKIFIAVRNLKNDYLESIGVRRV